MASWLEAGQSAHCRGPLQIKSSFDKEYHWNTTLSAAVARQTSKLTPHYRIYKIRMMITCAVHMGVRACVCLRVCACVDINEWFTYNSNLERTKLSQWSCWTCIWGPLAQAGERDISDSTHSYGWTKGLNNKQHSQPLRRPWHQTCILPN